MFRVHPALFRTDVVQARTPGVQFWTVLDLSDALIPKVRSPFPPVSTETDADPHLACLLHNKNKKWIKSLGMVVQKNLCHPVYIILIRNESFKLL